MSPRQALCLGILLGSTSTLAWGQHTAPTSVPTVEGELVNKTFLIGHPGEERPTSSVYHTYFIFQPAGRAVYRETRGTTVLKDSPLGWRLVGDSLYLVPSAFSLEAAGNTQRIERDPIKYAFAKVPGGYLLTRKRDQMLLREVE